jgi:hypothetical protein
MKNVNLKNESNNANTLLCDVDFSKLDDKELMSIGLKLMRNSVRNLLNKDAKEHTDFDRYMEEVERRQNNVT